MATVLLIIIFAVFIGLGLPDSLFGAAWPAIYGEFSLPISYANFITFTISLGTVIASFFAAKLINKFGTGLVTAVSTALSALMILGFSIAPSIWIMLALCLPLGFGAGAIDSALNNFVATHYSSACMNFLHCFYGVGVSLSPLLMSFALSVNNDWRKGYLLVFFIMAIITILSIIALPLWKKIAKGKQTETEQSSEFSPNTLTLKQMAKMPAVRATWVIFFSSIALEFTCGIWGASFFVEAENLSEELGSRYLTLYYVGIALGRLISGFLTKKMHPQKIVYLGYSIVGTAIILLVLPIPAIVKAFALFLIGLGNGPFFPNMAYLTPINFGKENSQSIVATQMAFCNIGILLVPPVFGFIADLVSMEIFPLFLLVLFIPLVVYTIIYNKRLKVKK